MVLLLAASNFAQPAPSLELLTLESRVLDGSSLLAIADFLCQGTTRKSWILGGSGVSGTGLFTIDFDASHAQNELPS
jgi:hypothetical protein